jgi:hypothetical protein
VLVEKHVEKLVKKKLMSKAKESQKMLQWNPMNSNGLDESVWRACSTYNGQCQENNCYKTSYKLRKQQKMEEF